MLHDASHADSYNNAKLTEVFHLIKASSGSKGFSNQDGELWEKVQIRFAGKATYTKYKQY